MKKVSRSIANPLYNLWIATKCILKYLAITIDFGIEFKPLVSLAINGFVDVDYVVYLDIRRSTLGVYIFP